MIRTLFSVGFAFAVAAVIAQGAAQKQECCEQDAKAPKAAAGKQASAKAPQAAAECQECEGQAKEAKVLANGKEECCKSTPAKPMAKGDPGCCNAKGEIAKFKVFVIGQGYKFFGCEESAAKGREGFLKKGLFVGNVQKVTNKVRIG
jgi:hypothetical protein